MRTETKTYQIYKFEELSAEAQQKAYENYLSSGVCEDEREVDSDDFRGTLDEIMARFGIRMSNWSVDSMTYWYSFNIRDGFNGCDELEEMTGERLYKYIVNNFVPSFQSRKQFYTRDYKRSRLSRIQTDWDYYALTGVYTDGNVTDYVKNYVENPNLSFNYHDFVDNLLDAFFAAWRDALAYIESFDYFREICDNNDLEFLSDGTQW